MKHNPRRPDRLTNPHQFTSAIHEAIYHALRPLDGTASEMESTWGVDRLPSLVSPETAAKFGAAKAKLDQAIEAEDSQQVVRKATVLMRGWAAMAEEAIAAGHKPLEVEAWAWESEGGNAFMVCKSNAHAHALVERGDIGGRIYSLEEVCRIVEAVDKPGLIGGVKDVFPDSTVSRVRPADEEMRDHAHEKLVTDERVGAFAKILADMVAEYRDTEAILLSAIRPPHSTVSREDPDDEIPF